MPYRIKRLLVALGAGVGLSVLLVLLLRSGIFNSVSNPIKNTPPASSKDAVLPTIVNGQLVLPKEQSNLSVAQTTFLKQDKVPLIVLSASVVGQKAQQGDKLDSIRIFGETANKGQETVSHLQPVVKFIDTGGNLVGQKIGKYSADFEFFPLHPGETTLYDVAVDTPPNADKVEIILGGETASPSAGVQELKIESRDFEVKTASNSATGEQVQYYNVSGKVVNTFTDYLTEITIVSWVKDKEGKVFAINKQQFKNDLLPASERLPFKFVILPIRLGSTYDTYEIGAWGKEFKLP